MQKQLTIIATAVFILFSTAAFARGTGDFTKVGLNTYLAPPRLIYPILDKVDLRGKDNLEFQWGNNDRADIDHFNFKLYKGYNTYQDNLILKKQVPSNAGTLKVEANTFEDNQVYTWVLIQVALGGNKSEPSFVSFRVIKK